jgi:hypothetical protein
MRRTPGRELQEMKKMSLKKNNSTKMMKTTSFLAVPASQCGHTGACVTCRLVTARTAKAKRMILLLYYFHI